MPFKMLTKHNTNTKVSYFEEQTKGKETLRQYVSKVEDSLLASAIVDISWILMLESSMKYLCVCIMLSWDVKMSLLNIILNNCALTITTTSVALLYFWCDMPFRRKFCVHYVATVINFQHTCRLLNNTKHTKLFIFLKTSARS